LFLSQNDEVLGREESSVTSVTHFSSSMRVKISIGTLGTVEHPCHLKYIRDFRSCRVGSSHGRRGYFIAGEIFFLTFIVSGITYKYYCILWWFKIKRKMDFPDRVGEM
jgi:hypothetical protein